MPFKKPVKIVAGALVFGGLFFGINYGMSHSNFNIGKILTPTKANLPDVADAQVANVTPIAAPTSQAASVKGPVFRIEMWEWNAQQGMIFAVGGSCTTKGSLMEKYGVNTCLIRQDDTSKMQEDLISCAKEIHDGSASCSTGANAVVIMGDGSAQFAAGVNPQLAKLGPDYVVHVIGAVGYSRGEDAFMAPSNVKSDPTSFNQTLQATLDGTTLPVKGLLVEGVLRDGDWNIALKWAGDNNIPNNPDEKTYDPDAINWVNASDYNVAAADYVAGKCEDRKEVSHGKLTGKMVHVCVNGVVTWTPGDVTVAEKRGGLVKVVSSKEYRSQMPAVLIGSNHWMNANRNEVQNFLRASFEGGDQLKAFDANVKIASKISAKVYGDEGGTDKAGRPYTNGAYWYRYFHPVSEGDATGITVSLGGSAVNNLADNKILFAMDGGNDNFQSTFNTFRTIDLQQYPELFKDNGPTPLPSIKQVEDKSYLTGLILEMSNVDSADQGAAADTVDYSKVGSSQTVSNRSYSINFATGSAQPLPDGVVTLGQIKDALAIGSGLKIKVIGYTDNTGSAEVNTNLSDARAQEVKIWLQQHAKGQFPDSRFVDVEGRGPASPIADNSTAVGKAANRRVEISLVD